MSDKQVESNRAGEHAAIVSFFHAQQTAICEALVALEQEAGSDIAFREDSWQRPGGGGGGSRVIEGGCVFERGGVNVSEVYGELEPQFANSLPRDGLTFYATGISLVLHPKSPLVPTVHANFRFLSHGNKAWFGGGADLTPYYFDAADKAAFHDVWRKACDRHADVASYETFSKWCEHYFYLKHRAEQRGVGGIFFDNLEIEQIDRPTESAQWSFVQDAASSFIASYLPIVRKSKDLPYTDEQRLWQEIRRGRYVEFNLVYDRGTTFGLKTNGRTESILMSMPPRVRWVYDYEPAAGSPEAAMQAEVRRELPQWQPPTR